MRYSWLLLLALMVDSGPWRRPSVAFALVSSWFAFHFIAAFGFFNWRRNAEICLAVWSRYSVTQSYLGCSHGICRLQRFQLRLLSRLSKMLTISVSAAKPENFPSRICIQQFISGMPWRFVRDAVSWKWFMLRVICCISQSLTLLQYIFNCWPLIMNDPLLLSRGTAQTAL